MVIKTPGLACVHPSLSGDNQSQTPVLIKALLHLDSFFSHLLKSFGPNLLSKSFLAEQHHHPALEKLGDV